MTQITRRGFLGGLAAAALSAMARVYPVPATPTLSGAITKPQVAIPACDCGDRHTLLCWAKRLDPDGSVAKIAEILSTPNDLLSDMAWVEVKP